MTTFGLLVGNRGFFPPELCEQGRKTVLAVLKEEGIEVVALTPKDTKYGSVETLSDAKKCAELFKANRDEDRRDPRHPAELRRRARHRGRAAAAPAWTCRCSCTPSRTSPGRMARRAPPRQLLRQDVGLQQSLPVRHPLLPHLAAHRWTPSPRSSARDLAAFAGVCRVVKGLRGARFGQIGARPAAFVTVRYSEKLLERAGISVESVDLSELFGRAWNLKDKDSAVVSKLDEIRGYVRTTKVPKESLTRMAKFAVVLDQYVAEHELAGTAIQCWTSMEENFGVVPCTAMSMLSNALSPSACETDVTGLVGMYAMIQASGQAQRPRGLEQQLRR